MRTISIPAFGTLLPEHGGHFGAIVRGAAADGSDDYVIIVPAADGTEIEAIAWATDYVRIEGADSLTDGRTNTAAMAEAGLDLGKRMRALTLHGHADWYLPAASELRALQASVPELFDKQDWCWSSTQYLAQQRLAAGLRARPQLRRRQGRRVSCPCRPPDSTSSLQLLNPSPVRSTGRADFF